MCQCDGIDYVDYADDTDAADHHIAVAVDLFVDAAVGMMMLLLLLLCLYGVQKRMMIVYRCESVVYCLLMCMLTMC